MGKIKLKTEALACEVLRRAGVPEAQLHSRMRRAGQGLFLLSIPFIIPLIILDHVRLGVTILLQTVYGVLVCLGVLLAFDEQEKPRR